MPVEGGTSAYVLKDSVVQNIVVEDPAHPVEPEEGFTILRGVTGGRIGDRYADGQFEADQPTEPPIEEAELRDRIRAARTIEDIKAILLDCLTDGESEVQDVDSG